MSNIILLYNSFSGYGKGMVMAHTIEKIMDKRNINYHSYKNQWPESLENSFDIWLIGGDGTVNYFLNKYGIINNAIAIFPGGTGNDFFSHLNQKLALEQQIDAMLQRQTSKIDIGLCNGKYFVNMVGLGFDGAVLQSIHHYKWLGGHLGYLVAVIRNIFSYKEKKLTITFLEQTLDKSLLLCIIANASRTGGGFKVSPHSSVNDGLLNWISCNALSILDRLILLPKVEKGKHMTHKEVNEQLATKLRFHADDVIAYQLDGELMMDSIIEISVVPSAMNVIISTY